MTSLFHWRKSSQSTWSLYWRKSMLPLALTAGPSRKSSVGIFHWCNMQSWERWLSVPDIWAKCFRPRILSIESMWALKSKHWKSLLRTLMLSMKPRSSSQSQLLNSFFRDKQLTIVRSFKWWKKREEIPVRLWVMSRKSWCNF